MKSPSVAKMAKMAGDSRSAAKFNAKLRKASKEGKLNPEFKAAVDAAPMKMKKESSKKPKERTTNVKPGGYTTHGNPSKYTTSSGKSVSSANIDEGNLSTIKTDSDGRKFVTVQDSTEKFSAGTKLYIK
jgi:cell envelope opacity-associated protein A